MVEMYYPWQKLAYSIGDSGANIHMGITSWLTSFEDISNIDI